MCFKEAFCLLNVVRAVLTQAIHLCWAVSTVLFHTSSFPGHPTFVHHYCCSFFTGCKEQLKGRQPNATQPVRGSANRSCTFKEVSLSLFKSCIRLHIIWLLALVFHVLNQVQIILLSSSNLLQVWWFLDLIFLFCTPAQSPTINKWGQKDVKFQQIRSQILVTCDINNHPYNV